MKYRFDEIGERIRIERIAKSLNQDDFIHALNCAYYEDNEWEKSKSRPGIIGRNTLSDIENGHIVTFDLRVLSAMAKVFNCEIGFLLCENGYENKTRQMTDIVKETGLHPKAISMLNSLSAGKGCNDETMILISRMITNSQFISLLMEILENKSYCKAMIEAKEEVKDTFTSDDEAFRFVSNSIRSSKEYRANMFSITHIFEEIVKDVTIGPAIIEYYEPQSSTNIPDVKPPIYANLLPQPSAKHKCPK